MVWGSAIKAPGLGVKFTGMQIYDGPSTIDGAPVVALATNIKFQSLNPKTGSMVQVYILRKDVPPIEAVDTGADVSICGDCVFRKRKHGGCYVNIGYSVNNVYQAFLRGRYEPINGYDELRKRGRILAGRTVRIGAYGDPAAVPWHVWDSFLSGAAHVIGYTHQWRTGDPRLRHICMASCESLADTVIAQGRGWRTFRVLLPDDATWPGNEILCPASKEAGARTTCAKCRLCGGTEIEAKSIAIHVHGQRASRFIEEFQ